MRKLIVATACLVVGGTLALQLQRTSLISKKQTSPTSSSALRLGATVPMTGVAASYGKLMQDGIELAREELSRQGIETEIHYQDVPSPGAPAVSAIRHLIEQDKIEALVANFWNPAIPVMAPAISNAKIISFHTAEADDKILGAGDYVFSTNATIRDESRKLAEYAYNTLGARKAAILYVGTTFGEHYNIHFTRFFQQLGGSVVYSEMTPLSDPDVKTPALKAVKSGADVIVTGSFGPILGVTLKALKETQTTLPILSTYETEDPSVIETAGELKNDQVLFFAPETFHAENSGSEKFRNAFKNRYGYEPRILAANAYDATVIAAKALKACGKNSECAKNFVGATKDFDGASGQFTIEAEGAATKPFTLKSIAHNQFVVAGAEQLRARLK